MKTISYAILLLAASVAVVVSAEEQAQCGEKTHDKAAAGVWAAKYFKTYLKAHPQVALGCDSSCCTAICTSAEVAGEVACALEIIGEPECGIAVDAAATACRLACPAAASVVLTTPLMETHDQAKANAWAAKFFEEQKQTHASILTPPNHPHFDLVSPAVCHALCKAAEVTCKAACTQLPSWGKPICDKACGIAVNKCNNLCSPSSLMETHDQATANAWAAQHFKEHKQAHASIALVSPAVCHALCKAAEVTCKAACKKLPSWGKPICDKACGIAVNKCNDLC